MLFSIRSKPQYSSVKDSDYDEESKVGSAQQLTARPSTIEFSLCSLLVSTFLLCISIVAVCTIVFGLVLRSNNSAIITPTNAAPPGLACVSPTIRREWRALSKPEKDDYISAVKCLGTRPSRLGDNGTLYDDFPRVHKATAPEAHAAAPFLPWHRYYIHTYEDALKTDCGYTGSLPYWDWSADWEDFENAPIWDSEEGFGSDGNATGAITVGNGRCVVDGPFAGLEAKYYDDTYQPHCLSRGFPKGEQMMELCKLIQPEVIDRIMHEPAYETFSHDLEIRAHRFISESIRGDFSKYTGPYDPVFFLHHTNIDRIWSTWQQTNPKSSDTAYSGNANSHSAKAASLDDVLDMGGLLDNIPVSEVMTTTAGLFCYKY